MTLSDSGRAIGVVADLLRGQLQKRLNDKQTADPAIAVTVGKAERNASSGKAVLNLTLYEIQFDPSMKNTPCEGVEQPIWLVLKFLMTGYDIAGDSDSNTAYMILSKGIQVLQELSFLGLGSLMSETDKISALQDNPEPLKITFDSISPDLISKLIQGTNEVFRVSAGFQIRPVLIAPRDMPSYPLLVGYDYTKNNVIGEKGVKFDLLILRQHGIESISPAKFEAIPGTKITLSGYNLDVPGLSVQLGALELPVVAQQSNQLVYKITDAACLGSISAGSHPVSVVKTLPNGRRNSSNVLNCDLMPVLSRASFVKGAGGNQIELEGTLLGGKNDDIIVILSQEDVVVRLIDTFKEPLEETQIILIAEIENVKPGETQVTLRVNGQQAANSPKVIIK